MTAANPNNYGITKGMSIPELARLAGLDDAQTLRDLIEHGEGPKTIRIKRPKRDIVRVLPCHAIAWLRSLEE